MATRTARCSFANGNREWTRLSADASQGRTAQRQSVVLLPCRDGSKCSGARKYALAAQIGSLCSEEMLRAATFSARAVRSHLFLDDSSAGDGLLTASNCFARFDARQDRIAPRGPERLPASSSSREGPFEAPLDTLPEFPAPSRSSSALGENGRIVSAIPARSTPASCQAEHAPTPALTASPPRLVLIGA